MQPAAWRNTLDKNAILVELSESPTSKVGKEAFERQSFPQKVFSAVWALEPEVMNGGFAQYFQNTSVETAPFVAEALDTIGATDTAAICRRATAMAFPKGLPAPQDAVSSDEDELPEDVLKKLDILDGEFFKYPNDLTSLLFAYVSSHPEEFGSVPTPDSQ